MHTLYKVSENDEIIEKTLLNTIPPIHSCDETGVGVIHSVLYSHQKVDIYSKGKDYIALMRPKQYLKNIFVFVPLFFAMPINNPELLIHSLLAFIVFSVMASAVYILNDYCDIENDRLHPKKKFRPLAAGKVSKKSALLLMAGLLLTSMTICHAFLNTQVLALILLYLSIAFWITSFLLIKYAARWFI